jgi:hypothetical protein
MFQTKVQIPVSTLKIGYEDRIMTLGSCFAENMGKKMQEACFDTEVNPFGVLYNPVSIRNSIDVLIKNEPFSENDLFQYNSLWHSFSHSSLFSEISQEKCLEGINKRLATASRFLKKTDFLLITFGTAWVFEEQKSGKVVSNCHKLPADKFIRRRLTVDEIINDYTALISRLKTLFPTLSLIFTVSPIRHWKDGAHENNLSKSTLLLAVDALQKRFENVDYFPAYEIQLDELRDYRFYAADMLHPSEVAIDYIWKRFCDTYFSDETIKIMNELEQLSADVSHRPLHPESEEYLIFKNSIEKKKIELIKKYPFLVGRLK